MAASIESNRHLGVFSLAFLGVSAMLGSGWLLASYFVFEQAGTYSMLSWGLGYVVIFVIAMSFAETCGMIHHDGATVILPRISHGYFLSALFGFFGLISWIALIPIEITATLQYLTHFVSGLYIKPGQLSAMGYGVALCLAAAIAVINCFSMAWIKKLNNLIFTPLKIGVPLAVIGYGLYHAASVPATEVSSYHSFKGIFMAIPLGVIFSFNAFKSVCEVGGRVKNPHYTIMRALLVSTSLCLLLYLGLQWTFNINATTAVLQQVHSPFAAMLSDSVTMLLLLYIGAVSSPFTANVFNLHAGNACMYRMSTMGYVPKWFAKMNRFRQYVVANAFNVVVAMLILLQGSAWDKMVNQLTCIMVITYAVAPIALIAFRHNLTQVENPVKLRFGLVVGFIGFMFCNFMIYWCGYPAVLLALKVLVVVSIIIVLYRRFFCSDHQLDLMRALWAYVWLGGIGLVSRYSVFEGSGAIPHGWALLLLAVLSALIYACIIRSCLPTERAHANFQRLCESDDA